MSWLGDQSTVASFHATSVIGKQQATETRVIEFVDFNALYATIQSTYPMPYSSYEFIPADEHDWSQMACDGEFGFF